MESRVIEQILPAAEELKTPCTLGDGSPFSSVGKQILAKADEFKFHVRVLFDGAQQTFPEAGILIPCSNAIQHGV